MATRKFSPILLRQQWCLRFPGIFVSREVSSTDSQSYESGNSHISIPNSLSYSGLCGSSLGSFPVQHAHGRAARGAAAVIAKTMMKPKPAKALCGAKGGCGFTECFLKGTQIITACGAQAIEDMSCGDLVLTRGNGLQPVQNVIHFASETTPVHIVRSALAAEVPNADLYVSPGHAILVDDVLVTAGSLVNGRTIRYAEEIDEPEYFHLEFANHELVYAHNVPCESFVEGRSADMVLDVAGARGQMKSHLRSALSPWIEVRQPVDILRDRLAGL